MKLQILNLTQHESTSAQREAGVYDLPESKREALQGLLTFRRVYDHPTRELSRRASAIADIAEEEAVIAAMVGGYPALAFYLHRELEGRHIRPYYAHSERVSVEQIVGGKTVKRSVFRHIGWQNTQVVLGEVLVLPARPAGVPDLREQDLWPGERPSERVHDPDWLYVWAWDSVDQTWWPADMCEVGVTQGYCRNIPWARSMERAKLRLAAWETDGLYAILFPQIGAVVYVEVKR